MKPSTRRSGSIRILGIDPGSRICGFGVLDLMGGQPRYVAAGALSAGPRETAVPERLARLHRGLAGAIRRYRPDALAVETPFVGRNVAAAFRIGEARGVILLAASEAGVPVYEYAPAVVKRSVVGHGAASKPQTARLVQAWLGLPATPESADAADALALALCHAARSRSALALRHAAFPPQISPAPGRPRAGAMA